MLLMKLINLMLNNIIFDKLLLSHYYIICTLTINFNNSKLIEEHY